MQFRNTEFLYGAMSKLLHWGIAVLVFTQFYLAYWVIWVLPENSPKAGFYIGDLHKPIGILILGIAIFAVFWKLGNPRPRFPLNMPGWETISARIVQTLLYLGLFILPVSGIIMSTAAGHPSNFFGLYQFPMFMIEDKAISQLSFNIHKTTSLIMLGLVVIHILAAFKHHFIDKDNVLKKMLPWKS